MGDCDCIADKFAELCPKGGELELTLRLEIKDSVMDYDGAEMKNECVEWHYYYITTQIKEKHFGAEVGSTLYNKGDKPVPRYSEGDIPVVREIISFLAKLKEKGANAKIVSDDSGLFEDIGTLTGCSLTQALVRAGNTLCLMYSDQQLLDPLVPAVHYVN